MSTREQLLEKAAVAWHDSTCPEGDECRSRDLHSRSNAIIIGFLGNVLDAVLPQITTVAELEALPDRTLLVAADGFCLRWFDFMTSGLNLLADHGPLTVIWQPEPGDRS